MKSAWLPEAFEAPRTALVGPLALSMLSPAWADQDFAAVQASAALIRGVFGPNNDWPPSDLTWEANRADLARHADEFERRVAFAYALSASDSGHYLGCLYLKPFKSRLLHDARRQAFPAVGYGWFDARRAELRRAELMGALAAWVARAWPFSAVAWPGLQLSWAEWDALAGGPQPA